MYSLYLVTFKFIHMNIVNSKLIKCFLFCYLNEMGQTLNFAAEISNTVVKPICDSILMPSDTQILKRNNWLNL